MKAKVSDKVKLVRTLRALYQKSKEYSFEEESRILKNIVATCEHHNIKIDAITMSDDESNDTMMPLIEGSRKK